MNPYTHERIGNWVGDYCGSEAVSELPASHKELLAPVLLAFLTGACEHRDLEPDLIEEPDVKHGLLLKVSRLDLGGVAEHAPDWCAGFLVGLTEEGRLSGGRVLGAYVRALRGAFKEAVSGKTAPIVRPSARIGRNDPCPCGSGRKYKKCCMSM